MARRKHPQMTSETVRGLVNQYITTYLVTKSLEMIRNKPADSVSDTLKVSNDVNAFFTK